MPIIPPAPPPVATPTSVAELAPSVLSRVQDPAATFWNLNLEVYSALVEAINDLMLIVGRPTLQTNTLITLNPNSVWQPMPQSLLAITNIRGSNYSLWKTSLREMDYTQSDNGSAWELDLDVAPRRWGPVGLNWFFIWPAVSVPVQVTIAGIAYPNPTAWPPTGAEVSCFHDEINLALCSYAEAYLRYKEVADDAEEGDVLYQQYLQIAKRLTSLDDRRDPYIFSNSFGSPSAPSQVTMR